MKKYLSVMAFSLLSLFSCKGYENLGVQAFETKLAGDGTVQLLDVRTASEFAEGHIAPAINIDWYSSNFLKDAEASLDKSRPVLVYCRSGRRSASAAAALEKAGFKVFNLSGGYLAWTAAGKPVTKYEVERFLTDSGTPVEITLIKHGSLEIRYKGKSIQVDPVTKLGDKVTDYASEFPKADIILVTHEHFDHLDKAAIAALTAPGTKLITNAACAGKLGYGTVMKNGDSTSVAPDMTLEAVPAYNTTAGHTQFHPKGRDNGFVLTIDGLRIYIAGDTEDIPEMAGLKDIDIAFLPVNQPYTMTPEQCIKAAKTISPKVLIPYHYGQTDLSGLPTALPGIDVHIRQMQ